VERDNFFLSDYQLFYQDAAEQQQYLNLENYLKTGKFTFETFPIAEHIEEYDHSNPQDCFCNTPDKTNPAWPKLHKGPNLIAAGHDAIMALDLTKL